MLLLREAALANLLDIRADRGLDRRREVRVLLDEARGVALVEAEQIVPDKDLAVAVGPAPIPIVGTSAPR